VTNDDTAPSWHSSFDGPDPTFLPEASLRFAHDADELMFRRWSAEELVRASRHPFRWTVRELLPVGTYGPIGGEKKTLKTYVGLFIATGIASGTPIFDHFEVPKSLPVVAYVGEGGRHQFSRRLVRVARSMDVRLAKLDVVATFDVAPIASDKFKASLARDLEELRPGLVWLDPLYVYQGGAIKSSDLYERGALLSDLSKPIVDAGASLLVGDHFNKTGTGDGLNRMTQAGMAEWADSWLLLAHRQTPDVRNGRFWLSLEVGSRQWGGNTWDLDLDLGAFDADTGDHVGDIKWRLDPTTGSPSADQGSDLVGLLRDEPWTHTKESAVRAIGGKRKPASDAFEALARRRTIHSAPLKRTESGRSVTRILWALTSEPVPEPDEEVRVDE